MENVDAAKGRPGCESPLHTPEGSFFVPSPTGGTVLNNQQIEGLACKSSNWENETKASATGLRSRPDSPLSGLPTDPLEPFLSSGIRSYTGLRLDRYTIHHGRYGRHDGDNSLIEALVNSAFDDHKSVRIVSEGSESVHPFVHSLAEEFLNSGDSVQVQKVTTITPESKGYVCFIEGIFPAVPRFIHIAQPYFGIGFSKRSALDASLAAACNMVGSILLASQPDGYQLQPPPLDTQPTLSSPAVSSVPYWNPEEDVVIPKKKKKYVSILSRLCGHTS